MLTPRVLTSYCVLLLQVLCRMKKLLSAVKQALKSDPSSRGSDSRSVHKISQDSSRSSSFVPSPHGATWSSCYPAHDDILETMDGDDISIHTTEEMEKYESLCCQVFAHTCVNDVNLLERVGLDEELPTILWSVGLGKLYYEAHLGSRVLTLEFLMTFETVEKNRKSFMKFHLFRNHLVVISPVSVSF
jgi:hypothetical protein